MNNPLRLTFSLIIGSACAFAGSLSPDLKALPPSTPVRVLIQFNGTPSTGTLNAIKADGGVQYRKFKHFQKLQGYTMTAGKAAGRLAMALRVAAWTCSASPFFSLSVLVRMIW